MAFINAVASPCKTRSDVFAGIVAGGACTFSFGFITFALIAL